MDELDKKILSFLVKDSRKTFSDISSKLNVAPATVHSRVEKMKKNEVIVGSKVMIDPVKLGLGVCTFIGINLENAGDYKRVLENLKLFDEIVEVHYTTGKYNLFIKVLSKDIQGFHQFLVTKLQTIKGVQATETLMSLDNPVAKDYIP